MRWPPVSLDATLAELQGASLGVVGSDRETGRAVYLVRVGRVRAGRVNVTFGAMTIGDVEEAPSEVRLPAAATLGEAVLGLAHLRPERAGHVPRIKWPTVRSRRADLVYVVALAIAIVATIAFNPLAAVTVPAAIIMGLVYRLKRRELPTISPRVVTEDGGEVLLSQVAQRLPPVAPALAGRALTPLERVEHIQGVYGGLLTDIVYRIENSALFDSAVPATQRFQLALLAWDPKSPDADLLADEVTAAFDEARRHAEQIGVAHLPESARADAGRAAKAATTALRSTNAGEREAARQRVVEILGSLALYYLPVPDPAAPALIGERKAIEPAP